MSCQKVQGDGKPLITLEVKPHGRDVPMRALFDTGASNNFFRTQSLTLLSFVEVETPRSMLSVRLATGATVTIPKRVIKTRFELNELSFEDEFIVLDLDDKFDVILGIPWMSKFKPSIDWIDCGGSTGSDHPVCNPAVSEDTTAASDSLVDSNGTTRSVLTRSAEGTSAEGLPHATEESLRVGEKHSTGDKDHRENEVISTVGITHRENEVISTVGNTHCATEGSNTMKEFRVDESELTIE
ncbi:hypothetical protein PsorP6_000442 [Peronosclerospora sorghi]|uniref:Uncharacterized protein n=1 Tax=Peronosclerospora sorghi TaxID=230839 RepID=A0ACC0WZQ1_9STRA|nr:hypothetical protein PsorP6_000442 [Peronosclerospora sorghi]